LSLPGFWQAIKNTILKASNNPRILLMIIFVFPLVLIFIKAIFVCSQISGRSPGVFSRRIASGTNGLSESCAA